MDVVFLCLHLSIICLMPLWDLNILILSMRIMKASILLGDHLVEDGVDLEDIEDPNVMEINGKSVEREMKSVDTK